MSDPVEDAVRQMLGKAPPPQPPAPLTPEELEELRLKRWDFRHGMMLIFLGGTEGIFLSDLLVLLVQGTASSTLLWTLIGSGLASMAVAGGFFVARKKVDWRD